MQADATGSAGVLGSSRPLRCVLFVLVLLVVLVASAPRATAVIVHLRGGATISYQRAPGARTGFAQGTMGSRFDAALSNLDYNGGPVMPSNTNYAVYWDPAGAPSYPGDYQPGIDQFFEDLAHDSGGHENVDSISAQYNDSAGEFARYSSHFGGALIDEDPYPVSGCPHAPKCLTDEQIRSELVKFATARHLPTDLAHQYFLFTPEGVESCLLVEEEGKLREACSANVVDGEFADFCAYHGNIPLEGGSQLIYAIDPFVNGKNCDVANHPNGKTSDSALTAGLSHEHMDSITDPIPNNAWTDWGGEAGQEIGDKCTGQYGSPLGKAENGASYNQLVGGHPYWYQEEWSNQSHQCLQRLSFSGEQPAATFTSEALTGTEMRFDASGSTAGAGVKYNWQFNDIGHRPSKASTIETSSPQVTHKFPASEQFLVALTVIQADGTSIGTARTIAVGDEGPTPAFSAGASPQAGHAVEFDGSGSADADGSISGYSWSFGDGSTGTGEKPSHAYATPGTYSVTLTITDASGQTASASHPLTVLKGSQAIEFTSKAPASARLGGSPYYAAAAASSGLPVSFSSATPWTCSVSGSIVSFTGAGVCTVDANQAGDANYEPAPQAQQTFAVGRAQQAIRFASTPPTGATVGSATYTVTATASSGLAVALSSQTPSVCSLSGSTVSFTGAGVCTIDADQAGDASYEPAPQVRQSFSVAARSAPSPNPFSAPEPLLLPFPDSRFSFKSTQANDRTGAITFTESVANPGTLTWLLTFKNGKFGVFARRSARCGPHMRLLGGGCRPARIVFATGAASVPLPGYVSFTARPSTAARRALLNALRRGSALPVVAKLTFQSALGGAPIAHTQSLMLRPRR
jgi:PKD repeat protein